MTSLRRHVSPNVTPLADTLLVITIVLLGVGSVGGGGKPAAAVQPGEGASAPADQASVAVWYLFVAGLLTLVCIASWYLVEHFRESSAVEPANPPSVSPSAPTAPSGANAKALGLSQTCLAILRFIATAAPFLGLIQTIFDLRRVVGVSDFANVSGKKALMDGMMNSLQYTMIAIGVSVVALFCLHMAERDK